MRRTKLKAPRSCAPTNALQTKSHCQESKLDQGKEEEREGRRYESSMTHLQIGLPAPKTLHQEVPLQSPQSPKRRRRRRRRR
jgi:hypothetical protein